MGSSFFKTASPRMGATPNTGVEARAIGAPGYKGRADAAGVQKALGVALAGNKSKFKPQKSSGAYPKGPKI